MRREGPDRRRPPWEEDAAPRGLRIGWLLVLALGLAAVVLYGPSLIDAGGADPEARLEVADPSTGADSAAAAGRSGGSAGSGSSTDRRRRVGAAAGSDGRSGQARDLSGLSPARATPIVRAANRITPSVVSVNVIRRQRVQPRSLLEEFFVPYGYEREVAGLGSGFAIMSDGYVLTNAHVVQGATEIVLTTVGGVDHPATLVGFDQLSDLALLKVDADLPVPEFGDSDQLVIGEPAIAIGNPFGYLLSNVEPTVTAGVISGVGRNILPTAYGTNVRQEGQSIYADMIQTDASINPGNSGGPLVNADGQVIGVSSTIFSRSGGSQGLGFAIPINRALRIADQLKTGEVRRPWVGIDVSSPAREGAGRRRSAVISRVVPNSPANRAGLEPGMTLLSVQGRTVKSPLDWEAELLGVQPGDTLELRVRTEAGRARRLQLPVEDLPSVRATRVEVLEGLELVTLTPAIRAERGLRSQSGALIVDVSQEVSRITGMRPGDLIVRINRWDVESAEDVASALDYMAGRGAVRVYYERNGTLWSTTFRITA